MTYEAILKPYRGALCKCLPIQSIGMWELVVPTSPAEHNGILHSVGKDCVVIVREDGSPTSGLKEVIPYSRVATFIPHQADAKGGSPNEFRSKKPRGS